MGIGRDRRSGRASVAAKAWPAAVGGGLVLWYAADSLRHRRESGHGYELRGEVSVGEPRFMRDAEALTGAPVSQGNDVELLVNGDAIFPAYVGAIKDARETVNLLTYAYWRGDIATDVAETLCAKARDGVECNVLIDAVGGAKMQRKLIGEMRDAGVTVHYFRPPKPYAVRRLQYRTHRKLLIVDGRVGFTGGVGIAEEWTGDAQDPDHWRDTHVRVRGPVVRGLQGAFAENWLEATGQVLAGEQYLPDLEPFEDGALMQVMKSSATVGDSNAEALYFLALAAARETIDLTSAYFVPRPAFTDALVEAAERGVSMRILVPGPHIDKEFVRTAGTGELHAPARGRDPHLRVPADDAAREGAGGRRGLVRRRLGELRQPLVPAPRRGEPVRAERGLRGPPRRGVRTRPRGVGRDRGRALERPRSPPARRRGREQARPPRALGARLQHDPRHLARVVPGRHVAAAAQHHGADARAGWSAAGTPPGRGRPTRA